MMQRELVLNRLVHRPGSLIPLVVLTLVVCAAEALAQPLSLAVFRLRRASVCHGGECVSR